jgi:valine dehydrogenase (NAD+)
VLSEHPGVQVLADTERLALADLDVYSPCALGEAIDDHVAEHIKARVICGAANNQLADDRLARTLADRGVLYAPDFCVNAGGLIQVADELEDFSFERAKAKAVRIYDTTRAVLAEADRSSITPTEAAERLAERRMASVGAVRKIWLDRRS